MSPRSLSHVLFLTSLGLAASAQGADLGPRPAPPAAGPLWSGFYAGVSLGGGVGTSRLAPRLSPLQQTTTTTTIAIPGGCQTPTGLYPVVGRFQGPGFFDVTGPNVVAPDGTVLGRLPNAGYQLNPVEPFNLVPAGPRTTELRTIQGNLTGSLSEQIIAAQNLVLAPGATPAAVGRNFQSLDPATNQPGNCRPVLAATDYLTGQVYDRTPNDTPVGTIQAAGTRTETSTATALVGPLAGGQGVDAATLAALAALPGQRRSLRTSGIVGGGQVGYNLQFGNVVAGLEADILGTGLSGRFAAGAFSARTSLDWFGTVRGRLGLAVDRVLVYATGGLAYGQVSLSYGLGGLSVGEHRLQLGWTAGGGAEFALTERVSLRAEYKYLDLGTATYLRPEGYDARLRTQAHVATAGLNYRF
ncbi:outer membrane protein [Methylobacterium sp. Gmos1]